MKEIDSVSYTCNFQVRPLEARPDGHIKAGVLTDMIQQAAWLHAVRLGVGTPELIQKGYTWVLNRLVLELDNLPVYPEDVTIITWPSGTERLFTFRHFKIVDKQGKTLGHARSAWMVIDLDRKRAVPPPDFIKTLPHHPDNDNTALYSEKQTESQNPTLKATIHVRQQDIDINDHVNNNVIIQWLYESIRKPGRLRYLDVRFMAECKLGDELVSEAEEVQDGFLHRITRKTDYKVIATGKTTWNQD